MYVLSKTTLYVIIGIVVAVMLTTVICKVANAADHAIVSFNDVEHLAVLQDSVVGVCDTVAIPDLKERIAELEAEIMNPTYSANRKQKPFVLPYTITCRCLVGVTVVPEVYGPITQTTGAIINTRQQAIIFYEPYKEEQ